MERTLLLKKGEIILSEDKITIKDTAKREHLIQIASAALWIFYGIMSVLRYTKTGDQFLLWTGLLIGVGHLIALSITLFKTTKEEVYFSEIEKASFKSRNGNKFLDLKLRSGLKRRISRIEPVSEELHTFLTEKHLAVE